MINVSSLESYIHNTSTLNADWGVSKEINFMPLVLEHHKKLADNNLSFSNAYTITTPRIEKTFQLGKSESIYPSIYQQPFSNALSQKQGSVSEIEYGLATNRLQALMKEISAFVLTEQGEKSELSFYLNSLSEHFSTTLAFKEQMLQSIKDQIANYDGDEDNLINLIDSYFNLYAPPYKVAMAFFDYASDKIEGLPVEQIMQDLATIKGYWDNNSRESLTLDNGTNVGVTRIVDGKGNATQVLNIIGSLSNNIEFDKIKLQNENLKTLLKMFKQRENLNENAKTNLNSNSTNSILSDFLNTKANSNKHSNLSNSLLKALLQGVVSDENSLKDLKA